MNISQVTMLLFAIMLIAVSCAFISYVETILLSTGINPPEKLQHTVNIDIIDYPKESVCSRLIDTKTLRMFFIILFYILALSFGNNATVYSRHIDNVILKFIVDATSVLFPPSRISLHVCTSNDDIVKLSREMSSNHLTHTISNFFKEFNSRMYNNVEHQNLYALDLDCDYAIEVLQQAHAKRMFAAPTKWLLLQDRRTVVDNTNVTLVHNDSVLEIFEDMAVYPDSDLTLARRYDGDFLQLTSVYRPSPQRDVIWEKRGNWTIENGLRMSTLNVASIRRKNLQQTVFKTCLVMTNPDTINHLADYTKKLADPSTRINYIWMQHLMKRMNATISFDISDTWGYRDANGSWTGMAGMLIRHEIDIAAPLFIIPERLGLVAYIQLYTRTGTGFIFRRPLLSTVKNIFTLPFHRNVWIALGVFLLLVFCSLYLSIKWEYYRGILSKSAIHWNQMNSSKPTISDNFLILLGAFAQQGYSYEPYKIPTRITTLMLLLAALSLYASYTANIVSLLQATTDSIKTASDLLRSPLKLAVEDAPYARYYFKSTQDPVKKAILEQRIEPKGRKSNWMDRKDGVRRIRNELFAFHAGLSPAYQIMEETFLEEEKCGLTVINYLNMIHPQMAVQVQSPYLEIIKNGALILREYGLKQRDENRLYTPKPKCEIQTGFITIGFTECYFAMVIMGYGILISVIIFVLELCCGTKSGVRTYP